MKQGDQWTCIKGWICLFTLLLSLAVRLASTIANTRMKHDNKSLQNTSETDLFIVHTTVKSRDRTSIILEGQTKLNLMWPTEEIYFLFDCNKIHLGITSQIFELNYATRRFFLIYWLGLKKSLKNCFHLRVPQKK